MLAGLPGPSPSSLPGLISKGASQWTREEVEQVEQVSTAEWYAVTREQYSLCNAEDTEVPPTITTIPAETNQELFQRLHVLERARISLCATFQEIIDEMIREGHKIDRRTIGKNTTKSTIDDIDDTNREKLRDRIKARNKAVDTLIGNIKYYATLEKPVHVL